MTILKQASGGGGRGPDILRLIPIPMRGSRRFNSGWR